LESFNLPFDWFSFAIILWNFGVGGLVAIFWYAPLKITQGYLILISVFMAVFFTKFPEWTTWAILAAVAIYDVFAVLCPKGPLKVLVELAQERQEPIPALLYSGFVFMMKFDDEDDESRSREKDEKEEEETPEHHKDEESSSHHHRSKKSEKRRSSPRSESPSTNSAQPSTPPNDESNVTNSSVQSEKKTPTHQESAADALRKRKSVKLGLGDFIFYSVLVGRAALYDIITVFTCFIAIITGLFFTLLLLALANKALPALPISIALGLIFFFTTKIFLLPFVLTIGAASVFV